MSIKEYLYRNNMTASDLARKIGVTPAYFLIIKNGHLKPGRYLAKQIEQVTGGQVTEKELRP